MRAVVIAMTGQSGRQSRKAELELRAQMIATSSHWNGRMRMTGLTLQRSSPPPPLSWLVPMSAVRLGLTTIKVASAMASLRLTAIA